MPLLLSICSLTILLFTTHAYSFHLKKSLPYKVITYEQLINPPSKVLSCYYNIPTLNDLKFPVFPEQIDPFLCTHILIAFAKIQNFTVVPGNLRDLEFYNRTIRLKLQNPLLKVLLSVGGASKDPDEPNGGISAAMATNITRARLIGNSIKFIETFGFDGLDLDWEFPNTTQRGQLSDFAREFKNFPNSLGNTYILTLAVCARKTTIDLSYDIPRIAKFVDFINLMTYDFHSYTTFTPLTGPNSPLHPMSTELGYLGTMNVAWASKYWEQNGMPSEKIVIGIPTYGRTFRLVDEVKHDYYCLADGVAEIAGTNGYISFPDACSFISQNGTNVVFNEETMEPYAYNKRNWISYSNIRSTAEKAHYVMKRGYLGASVYNLNSDDAWKICPGIDTKFPIVTTIKKILFST